MKTDLVQTVRQSRSHQQGSLTLALAVSGSLPAAERRKFIAWGVSPRGGVIESEPPALFT